mmetsp:Transcript_9615/g.31403  ORF Transcript_9615/g.31403 Transcript_9615/m.31403 type:complete len:324 (-) Transcript_9615:161-1132(-)
MAAARGVLVALIGLPAAGKSTLARQLGEDAEWIRFDDDLEAAVTVSGRFDEETWRASRAKALARVGEALSQGKALVLADDNCFYRSMRHTLFKLARDSFYAFATVFLDVDVDVAIARNAARTDDRVPDDTITKMAAIFERPDPDDHPWERHSLVLRDGEPPDAKADRREEVVLRRRPGDVRECDHHQRECGERLRRLVEQAREAGAPPKPLSEEELRQVEHRRDEARKETAANASHNVDLTLRRLVGDVLKDERLASLTKDHRKRFAAILNDARKVAQKQSTTLEAALAAFSSAVLASPQKKDHGNFDVLAAAVEDRRRSALH